MKKLVLFFSALVMGASGALATSTEDKVAERNAYRNNDAFIFVENGITFSVYPDGEFDFYIDQYVTGRRNGVTFNSGFDYNPYVQYDDYGAVIQVENVPVFYDYYGRVTQIGDVDISYNSGRVHRLGGMYVYYNRRGFYDYHTGYINVYNRRYIYRPFHALFVRPALGFCLVFNKPYRRYYNPVRYTYYKPYRYNQRRAYAQIGRSHKYNQVRKDRAKIYRNDRRVAVRSAAPRTSRSVASNTGASRSDQRISRNQNVSRSNQGRSSDARKSQVNRSSNTASRTVKRSTSTTPNGRSVSRKSTTVTSPRGNTVTPSKRYRCC